MISSGIFISTEWAGTVDIPIRQKHLQLRSPELFKSVFLKKAICQVLFEDILSNDRLLVGGGSSKVVKVTLEPVIYLLMDDIILITEVSW